VLEHARAVGFEVFDIDQNFGCAFEKPLQLLLAFHVLKLPQVAAVEIKQIEGMIAQSAGFAFAELPPQRLKIGKAGRAVRNGFAVKNCMPRLQAFCRRGDGRIALSSSRHGGNRR
jgi:hypothetical protein